MPWILKGHVTWVRNRLIKRYSLKQLMNEDVWYREVIEAPERDFKGVHDTDIFQMYKYYSPSVAELSEVATKFGNCNPFTVVVYNLTDLYELAFQNAIKKLS